MKLLSLIFILFIFTNCYPARDKNNKPWRAKQVAKRMFAKQYYPCKIDLPTIEENEKRRTTAAH